MNDLELCRTLKQLGLSQRDLADLLDVTMRSVSYWITGERRVPGPVAAFLRLFAQLPDGKYAPLIAARRQRKVK